MAPTCIDLKQLLGEFFKVVTEDDCRSHDPWLYILLCQRGQIVPFGSLLLMACTNVASKRLVNQLLAIPTARLHQDGADGANVVFDIAYIDQVAKIMKPRRRRRLSPVHKAKLHAANVHTRFGNGTQGRYRRRGRNDRDLGDSEAA